MLAKSLARLSSGSKIVSPDDDAAGLAVSMKFDAQSNRIDATSTNVGNAISFTQTQDGFLSKVSKALDRMSTLAVLSQDVTKTDSDRTLYNAEYTQLASYITDLSHKDFNGVSLFSGATNAVTIDSEANTWNMNSVQYDSQRLHWCYHRSVSCHHKRCRDSVDQCQISDHPARNRPRECGRQPRPLELHSRTVDRPKDEPRRRE